MFTEEEKQELVKNSTWCPYLFQQMMVSPIAEVRPCCRFDARAMGGEQFWDQTQPLTEFYKNAFFENIREKMRLNENVAGCAACYSEEASGVYSMRQKSIYEFADASLNEITGIEIGVGRVCNLKCRSCDADYSTKWAAENEASGKPNRKSADNIDLDQIPIDQLPALREIKVTGGEPFMHPKFIKLLKRLADSGLAAAIEIEIFSNCTLPPPQAALETFKAFRGVIVSLSIDAVGARGEYIRHPSKWPAVESTFRFWLAERAAHLNLSVRAAATVSIYNVLYVFELLEWIFTLDPGHRVIFQLVHSPRYLSVYRYPQGLKQALHRRLREQEDAFRRRFKVSDKLERSLSKVFNLTAPADSPKEIFEEFFAETADLDRIRGENYAKTFPELAELISSETTAPAAVAESIMRT